MQWEMHCSLKNGNTALLCMLYAEHKHYKLFESLDYDLADLHGDNIVPIMPFKSILQTLANQLYNGIPNDKFYDSGPVHLTQIDWSNAAHKRSMVACLVQGVYVLERDRQLNRVGPDAWAPPWWEHFNFQITRKLVDDEDMSIFGAIYEYVCVGKHTFTQAPPKFVIAFRGTMIKLESFYRDFQLDLHFILNTLHRKSRCTIAMQAVRNVVAVVGASNVWLAGHSLGSAMAMLAGREMATSELFLETFLFNPPFISVPIEIIRGKKLKKGIRVASSVITVGLVVATNSSYDTSKSEDTFAKLSPWFPRLFVNPRDLICSEYAGYFEHREKMEKNGLGIIEKLATKTSITDLIFKAFGKESETSHLIPSASLTINMSPCTDLKSSHGIHQWWRQDLNLNIIRYEYS